MNIRRWLPSFGLRHSLFTLFCSSFCSVPLNACSSVCLASLCSRRTYTGYTSVRHGLSKVRCLLKRKCELNGNRSNHFVGEVNMEKALGVQSPSRWICSCLVCEGIRMYWTLADADPDMPAIVGLRLYNCCIESFLSQGCERSAV